MCAWRWLNRRVPQPAAFVPLPKLAPGDRVAVLSPSFAAPGFAPAIHERAMQRFFSETGLVPVEYATTRTIGASAEDRAADINAAFADPSIRALFTTVGGDDQITVVPHLNAELAISDPKPFFGYSDNTNIPQLAVVPEYPGVLRRVNPSAHRTGPPSTRCI